MGRINRQQLRALGSAVPLLREKDYAGYLELRSLLPKRSQAARARFRVLFSSNYGLNSAGLTEQFKERYFHILFHFSSFRGSDLYSRALRDLYKFPRLKGDPSTPGGSDIDFRIAGFVASLEILRDMYLDWSQDQNVARIMERTYQEHPDLAICHPVRVFDFLVWKAGDKNLI